MRRLLAEGSPGILGNSVEVSVICENWSLEVSDFDPVGLLLSGNFAKFVPGVVASLVTDENLCTREASPVAIQSDSRDRC